MIVVPAESAEQVLASGKAVVEDEAVRRASIQEELAVKTAKVIT